MPLLCVTCAVAILAAGRPAPVALTVAGDQVSFTAAELSAGSAASRLVSVYWADTPDIWDARAWIELPADAAAMDAVAADGRVEVRYASFGGRPIHARLVGTPDRGAGEIRWSMTVRNVTRGVVVGVAGPVLREITDLAGGALYYPNRPGQRLRDPWEVLRAGPTSMAYPVPGSMQYLAYTARRAGVAYHVLDPGMAYKLFAWGGPEREMRVLQFPFMAPGEVWEAPPVVWQALPGDWHAAADRYRAWYATWATPPNISPQVRRLPTFGGIIIKARPVDDPNIRDVPRNEEFGTYARALTECLRLGRAGFQGMHVIGWFGRGHDTTYPEFAPADDMGGVDGLKALVQGMHDADMLVTMYLNARLANVDGAALAAHPEWQVLEGGPPYTRETWGDQVFAVMCPASPTWQAKLREEVVRVARDYDADGVQLDQVGAATTLLCFDRAHGHRTPATAWAEGYPRLLADARDSARVVDPAFWTWIEGAWEGAGPHVDLSQGGFWPQVAEAEAFPRMYRYTLPDHPMAGDPGTGSVPYWSPTDINRARRVIDAVGPLFWSARYRDDQGLVADPDCEAVWFRAESKAIVTLRNLTATDADLTVRLALAHTGEDAAPSTARALAAGLELAPRLEQGDLVVTARVPARQVEAVLLEW